MVLLLLNERQDRKRYFLTLQGVSVITGKQAARFGVMPDDTGTTWPARRLQSSKSTIFQRQIKRLFFCSAL